MQTAKRAGMPESIHLFSGSCVSQNCECEFTLAYNLLGFLAENKVIHRASKPPIRLCEVFAVSRSFLSQAKMRTRAEICTNHFQRKFI